MLQPEVCGKVGEGAGGPWEISQLLLQLKQSRHPWYGEKHMLALACAHSNALLHRCVQIKTCPWVAN